MHRHFFGLAVAAGVIAAAGGCVSDPTGDLSGTPDRIVTSVETIFLQPGDSALITAELRDAQGVALQTLPEVTSSDPTIASVTVADLAPFFQRRFYVKAVGAGSTNIVVSSGSVSHTVTAVAFPATFDGAISTATGGPLDTVTITASAVIGFDSTATTVTLNDSPTFVISRSSTELKLLALDAAAVTGATVTLHDVIFLPGSEDIELVEVAAAQTVDLSGDDGEPANDASGGANALTLNTPFIGSISDADVTDYLTFTLAADGVVTVTLAFEGTGAAPDIDATVRNAALVNLSGNSMATAAQPETWTSGTLLAGTYYVRVDWYDSGSAAPPHWYRVTVSQ